MSEKPKRLWIALDKNGNQWGPFDTPSLAANFAGAKWPTKPGYIVSWSIVALRHPDE